MTSRREFITLVGGAVAAWPLAARAQQGAMRRIGVAAALAEDDPEMIARRAAFEQALQVLGWTAERNIRIEYRLAGFNPCVYRKLHPY
jgi:putative ABC transport system substrate-binding protein